MFKISVIKPFFFLIGIHPTTISESFQRASTKSIEILEGMSMPVLLTDRESLLQSATTSLNSKVNIAKLLVMFVISDKMSFYGILVYCYHKAVCHEQGLCQNSYINGLFKVNFIKFQEK